MKRHLIALAWILAGAMAYVVCFCLHLAIRIAVGLKYIDGAEQNPVSESDQIAIQIASVVFLVGIAFLVIGCVAEVVVEINGIRLRSRNHAKSRGN